VRSQVWSYLGSVPAGAATFSVTTADGSVTAGRAVITTGTADGMLTRADLATASGLNTTSGKVTLDSGADAGIGFVATGSSSAITSGVGATVVDVALTADGNSHGGIGHESPFTGSGVREVGFFGGMVTAGNSVGLMLAETDVLFTPARLGLEAGVAPGLALVIGADRMLLPSPRAGVVAGIALGLRLEVEGPRQVMLAGGPETSALTEGGVEGQVLTYHARRRPTWEAFTASSDRRVFTTSGSWSKPAGDFRSARITCIGGGGGGGSGRRGANGTNRMGGSGGGGGGVTIVDVPFAELAATYDVVVGAGGAGGAGTSTNGADGSPGTPGGASYVGAGADTAVVSAAGGRGGRGGVEGTIADFTPGGGGTLPGQWGGAGNNTGGLDAGSSIIEQAGSNANLRISLAGGGGGGGGGGGRASNDSEYGGGELVVLHELDRVVFGRRHQSPSPAAPPSGRPQSATRD
jgi:hypothetical protein